LPQRAWLRIGQSAVVEITGLRTPCAQLNELKPGLMSAVLSRDDAGDLVRRAGVMGIVVADGEVRPGDAIRIELPNEPHRPLGPV
jgi:MOSC domain-containing protein YiiM